MKVYTYANSLNTIYILMNDLMKMKPNLTAIEAQNIVWDAIGEFPIEIYDAIYYENRHVICTLEGNDDLFAIPISKVAINPKKIFPRGHEKEYMSKTDLTGYFRANLPHMPKVEIGKDVPKLEDIRVKL